MEKRFDHLNAPVQRSKAPRIIPSSLGPDALICGLLDSDPEEVGKRLLAAPHLALSECVLN